MVDLKEQIEDFFCQFCIFVAENASQNSYPVKVRVDSSFLLPMRHAHQTGDQSELIRQCDEWIVAHRHRLLACARQHADEMTDVDLLLTDTLRKVARVFCRRRMSEELMIRYTMRSLRNGARDIHRRNMLRLKAEDEYGQEEWQRRQQQEATMQENETHATLRDVLQQLPTLYATVLTMKLWQRMTFADIAAQLGVAESTVRRYYESAVNLVRKRMSPPES